VQAAGAVFLDDEARLALLFSRALRRRLGGLAEVALALILAKLPLAPGSRLRSFRLRCHGELLPAPGFPVPAQATAEVLGALGVEAPA
jgi:hypothetical protein